MPLDAERGDAAIRVVELRADSDEPIMIVDVQVPRERGNLEMPRVPINEHTVSEQVEQRPAQRAREVPEHVGAPRDDVDLGSRETVGLARFERRRVLV